MSIATKTVKGRKYLYFAYYDPQTKKKKEIYCGQKGNEKAMLKALSFRREYLIGEQNRLEKRTLKVQRLLDATEKSMKHHAQPKPHKPSS